MSFSPRFSLRVGSPSPSLIECHGDLNLLWLHVYPRVLPGASSRSPSRCFCCPLDPLESDGWTVILPLSDLDGLCVLAVGLGGQVQRIRPDDAGPGENLGCLVESGDTEFFLTFDDEGRPDDYVQHRHRHSIWLNAPEACLEDRLVAPYSRWQGVGKDGLLEPGPVPP